MLDKYPTLVVPNWLTNNFAAQFVAVRVMANDDKVKALDAAEFASKQLGFLEKERLAEVVEVSDAITLYSPSQLQSRGLALLNLVINSVRTGLGGKT